MIALDTNLLLRFLVRDDPGQAERVRVFIDETLTVDDPGFVSSVVVVEIAWVLEDHYGRPPEEIKSIFARMLETPQLLFEQEGAIAAALQSPHPDLADALIHEIGKVNGCTKTLTLDRRFARLGGVELLC